MDSSLDDILKILKGGGQWGNNGPLGNSPWGNSPFGNNSNDSSPFGNNSFWDRWKNFTNGNNSGGTNSGGNNPSSMTDPSPDTSMAGGAGTPNGPLNFARYSPPTAPVPPETISGGQNASLGTPDGSSSSLTLPTNSNNQFPNFNMTGHAPVTGVGTDQDYHAPITGTNINQNQAANPYGLTWFNSLSTRQ